MSQEENKKETIDAEVVPKAAKRQYTAEYKRRVLQEYEACTEPGERGALLRREGLYSSNITNWRHQRERGELGKQLDDGSTFYCFTLSATSCPL